MNVKQLKEKLEGLPDDVLVVTHGSDHSYNKVRYVGVCDAEDYRGDLFEYYSDEDMVDERSKKVKVFLVSDM